MTEWAPKDYSEDHRVVEKYQLKKQLDVIVASHAIEALKASSVGQATVVEFGCGRGPVSELVLKGVGDVRVIGIDGDEKMIKRYRAIGSEPQVVGQVADLRQALPTPIQAQAAVSVNAWYATTFPDILGVDKLEQSEALGIRKQVLENMALCIVEGGTLVISEPVITSESQGLTKQMQKRFIQEEFKERYRLGRKKNLWSGFLGVAGGVVQLFSPSTLRVSRKNKELFRRVHLFTLEEMVEFIENTGLFTVEKVEEGLYAGLNGLVVVKRTGKLVEVATPIPAVEP